MLNKSIDVRKVLLILYCVIPFVFYGLPFVLSLPRGYLRMYFFNVHNIPSQFFFVALFGHLALGYFIYRSVRISEYTLKSVRCKSSNVNFLIILLYVIYLFVPLGYFGMITNVLFLVLLGRHWPGRHVFIVLTFIAFLKLLFGYDRYHFVVMLLLWNLPALGNMKPSKLVWLFLGSIFIMVYVLQPIKAGYIPFSDSIYTLAYSVRHMFPIYIGAYLSYESDFGVSQLLAESIPLYKSLSGSASSIELIAEKGLPTERLNSGTRFGSNSALFFSNYYGYFMLASMLTTIKLSLKYLKNTILYNTILLLLVTEGPMFIRHSFGQAFINLSIGIVISIIVHLFVALVNSHKIKQIGQ